MRGWDSENFKNYRVISGVAWDICECVVYRCRTFQCGVPKINSSVIERS